MATGLVICLFAIALTAWVAISSRRWVAEGQPNARQWQRLAYVLMVVAGAAGIITVIAGLVA